MLLPLLLIGIAVAVGLAGIGKTIKAGVDTSNAQKISNSANDLINNSKKRLKLQRDTCEKLLGQLEQEKQFVQNNSMKQFVDTFSKIKNVDYKNLEGLEKLRDLHIDDEQFAGQYLMTGLTRYIAGGAAIGAAGGALVAFAVYKAVQILAHASTGTAIASLKGAAATKATLAFIGGGSLAAGGLGMAGGTIILGAIVICPTLLLMGIFAGNAAKKNLEGAYMYQSKAVQIVEKIDASSLQYESIRKRLDIFNDLSEKLDGYFLPFIYKIEDILKAEGDDYRLYNNENQNIIASYADIIGIIKAVLDTELLKGDSSMTEESEKVVTFAQESLEKIEGVY